MLELTICNVGINTLQLLVLLLLFSVPLITQHNAILPRFSPKSLLKSYTLQLFSFALVKEPHSPLTFN